MKHNRFTRGQWRIFILCWVAYASAYMCRTNLSIAIPGMTSEFSWSLISVGWLGTAFFWAYAIGQLVNGCLGDYLSARILIFTGLLVSSAINLLVGFIPRFDIILLLWIINGFVLSTVWPPIVKTVGFWFPVRQQSNVAVAMNFSMIGGYLLSWGLVGVIVNYTSWRFAFFIPGLFTLVYAVVFLLFMRDKPVSDNMPQGVKDEADVKDTRSERHVAGKAVVMWQILKKSHLWMVAIVCMAQGLIKDGIALWVPTILQDVHGLTQSQTSIFSTIIPLVSLLGILAAGYLSNRFHMSVNVPLLILMGGMLMCSVLLFLLNYRFLVADILIISISSALMYGANTLLLAILPLHFTQYQCVSSVAGFLDFCSYLGAGLSGVLTGVFVERIGWIAVPFTWGILTIASMSILICLFWFHRKGAVSAI